ncbi:hypothetical protein ACIO3O_07250 [Streptomyces sp. NPDC087440]|uniref:hypothetical protein n=1 Tax=Streptomyces sp. NPDC087440 TaxID=3365790 RepID=UPI0038085523
MSAVQTERNNPETVKPALVTGLLVVALIVGTSSLEGVLRNVVGGALAVALLVSAGFTGAAIKRSRLRQQG